MNDRELLELAAKAAGLAGKYVVANDDYYYCGNARGIEITLPDGSLYIWNPLTDDGDALRLAVKLGFLVDCASACVRPLPDSIDWQEASGSNDYANTRRAIVRAAAEIGKGIKT